MNNELISREWLEDAFDNLCCHNCKICRNFRIEDSFYKCALIDNAPTVEPEKVLVANVTFDEDKLKEIVDTEVIEKIKSGDLVVKTEERQTGEWKTNLTTGDIFCSCCKEVRRDTRINHINFCNSCGARMLRASEVMT